MIVRRRFEEEQFESAADALNQMRVRLAEGWQIPIVRARRPVPGR